MPSTTPSMCRTGAIGVDSVSVPELTSSPAASGSAPACGAIADASSARHSAGLRSEFLPDAFLDQLSVLREPDLERGSCSTSSGMLAGATGCGSPTISAACRPKAATKSAG